jgi:phosphatidate cytidylyltransferase
LALVALVVAAVWFSPWGTTALVCLALLLALKELVDALGQAGFRVPYIPLAVGAVATQVAAAISGASGAVVGAFLTLAAAALWRALELDYKSRPAPAAAEAAAARYPMGAAARAGLATRLTPGGAAAADQTREPPGAGAPPRRSLAQDMYATAFAVLYLPVFAAMVVLIGFMEQGRWLVLLVVAVPVASDTGGYFAGLYLGKHKLAPNVSPKKTWEGLGGSVELASVAGIGGMLILSLPWYLGLAVAVLGALAGTLGDLAESLLKRAIGIKDMGSLLPGHGGVLDRVDSVLMTVPFAYALIILTGVGTLP